MLILLYKYVVTVVGISIFRKLGNLYHHYCDELINRIIQSFNCLGDISTFTSQINNNVEGICIRFIGDLVYCVLSYSDFHFK